MSQLLDQLTRNIATTELWWGLFFILLLVVGLCLLGYGLNLTLNGTFPWFTRNGNGAPDLPSRVVYSLIGIGLFVPGLIGFYRLTSMTTLEVLVSFSEEEYARFRILEKKFNEEHAGEKLRIRSDNVEWPDLVRRLKQKRIDVIIFDVTRRLELLREELLKPLDDRRRLIPSSVNPTLLDDMNFEKKLYFLPFRPNVRIGWWNDHHPTARACAPKPEQTEPAQTFETTVLKTMRQEVKEFPTWQEVREFATRKDVMDSAACIQPAPDPDDPSEARLAQYRVVLSANGVEWKAASDDGDKTAQEAASKDGDEIASRRPPLDSALLLLEVLMASGKKPWHVCESWRDEKNEKKEDAPLKVLRDVYRAASPRSSDTDWQTATGHLLSRHVALARNWSFSIATMRDSGELQHFHPHVAWAWKGDGEKNNRFRTLLGGDVIALPRYGREGDAVYNLLRFLISKDVQTILVEGLPNEKQEGLTWPPMRLDVGGTTSSEDKKLQDQKELQKIVQGNGVPRVDTPSPLSIQDEECHGNLPTGDKVAKCARLHLYLARDVVREAMLYAAPTPKFWSPEMHESFTSAFHALVSTENEEQVASKLEEVAGLYCLAPGGETPNKKKLVNFIGLDFEGFPNAMLNDVLDPPHIRVKLVKAKGKAEDPPKAASHHTDLCVQLYSDNDKRFLQPIKIPAGFTSARSEPVSALLFPAVKVKKATAWELEDPNAECQWEWRDAPIPKDKVALVHEKPSPLTVVVLPFTSFAFLVLGALIGTFLESKRQQSLLDRLRQAVRAPFMSLRRGLQVVLFILVVLPLWSTLVRLEYAKEVRQFFLHVPGQAWLIPCALLLGFVLEMAVERVASSGVRRWHKWKVKTKT
jgi:hypothetical protein